MKTKSAYMILLLGWTILMILIVTYSIQNITLQRNNLAKAQGIANLNKDQAIRSWVASHGGLYVPIDTITPPNENLSNILERDITTPSGRKLTLMDPAYMIRQLNEYFEKYYGVVGHITSKKLLRAENKPDAWELKALNLFEEGTEEVSEFTTIGENSYYRYIRPMYTKSSCLKCHSHQGYKVGDIRGGVSVSIPLKKLNVLAQKNRLDTYVIFSLIWLTGVIGLSFGHIKHHKSEQALLKLNADLSQKNNKLEILNDENIKFNSKLRKKNKELSQFTYIASHDLQEPLNTIIGFSEILKDNYSDKLEGIGKQSLEIINHSTLRMKELVADLLKYSRIGKKTELEKVDVNQIIENIKTDLNNLIISKKATIIYSDLFTIKAYKNELSMLFLNLITNAIKYSKKDVPPRIEIKSQETEGEYIYTVTDNGIGIDMQFKDKIFEVFQRLHTRDKYSGTGIGLANCARIAELHKGKIWVESEINKGSIFTFTIKKVLNND